MKKETLFFFLNAVFANIAIAYGIRSNHIYTTQMIQDNDTKRSSSNHVWQESFTAFAIVEIQ